MEIDHYHHTIAAKVSPEEAFTMINRVPDWWTRQGFSGATGNRGDCFTVRWGDTFVDFEVTELLPGRRIVWQVKRSRIPWVKDQDEWTGTSVEWDITSENGGSRITITHRGLTPAVECYQDCKQGWDFYAGESLRKLLSEGKGMPDKAMD
jgi:hypothetical protein